MKIFFTLLIVCFFSFLSKAQIDGNLKAYNNFDFVPGEKVLFDDDFSDATIGEFPPRWKLHAQQGVVNQSSTDKMFVFTESTIGGMGRVEPRMKVKNYLSNSFTVEFDFMIDPDEMIALHLTDANGDNGRFISIEFNGLVKTNYFGETELKGYVPGTENISKKWHHAAFAYKDGQMKCYINQHRVLVIPNCEFQPVSLQMAGSLEVKFRNFRMAEGGGMNMLNKILTDGKFVSHAVKFDVNKATIKGESMGFLNELAKWMKENPSVKLEIAGHTDSDGDEASNQKLSDQRAEAVKKALISLGVDGSRLSSKGYGESKAIGDNNTPEGRANNRRVEFVKMK